MRDIAAVFSINAAVTRLARFRTRPWWMSALIGLGCAAVALLIRAALNGFYGNITGFMILLPAVIVASLTAGRLAGMVATLACLYGGWLVLGLATVGAGMADPRGMAATAIFLVVGLFITVVGAALRDMVGALDTSLEALRSLKARFDDSEHQLSLISEHAPVMLWMSDADGQCVHLNAAQRAFWSAPDSPEAFDLASMIHPDDAERVLAATIDGGARQAPFEIEGRFRRHDGTWRILHTDARPRIGPDGRYEGMIGVNTDVTDARAAEAGLRESESRFRLMADTAPSPVWMTNAEAQVEFVNAALVDFYGQPADRLLGHAWKLTIHPEDQSLVDGAMAAARPDRLPYGFEARFRRADGAWRWMRISVKPRIDDDGQFLGYVGMSFDVTETREALDALARQERRQSFLLALTDRVRDLTTPDDIMMEVERALGSELGADRVGYGEVDQERGLVSMRRDWTHGVVSAQGEFRLADLGADLIADLAEGRLIRIADVRLDPRTQDALEVFQRLQTRALMRAPVIRGGRLRAFLYAHHSDVREWTEAESGLLQEVAARTWSEIERTRAAGEVLESEERFRAIADTAPVLIWVTQQDRTRAFVNQAYVAYNGGTYDDARLADWRAIVHPDDHERILRESLDGEASGQPFSMEARYLRHDGEYRWLKSFSRPRLDADDQVIGFVGVAFDVTDIREAQARLLESETRFRTVADSAPALIWMLDAEGRPSFVNRRFRTFFGIESEAQVAEGWNALIHPDDREALATAFSAAFERRDRFESLIRVRHPVLGERWLRCEGLPRFDGSNAFQGYVGANIDVTEAKGAEEDLKRINELLEERVGEALAEKAKAEADLMHAQRMEAVGRLTGGVAHDFNNLLTVVIGALDIILRSPDDAAKRQKLGEAALAAARRGEGLTHQLLAFSRRQALRPQAMDLNDQIRESEPLLRRAVGEAVQFKLKLRRGGATVSVDPSQFEAALLNLVVNARDAVEDKGRITVQTKSCTVQPGEVPDLAAGDYVCVTVSDNGSGMSPELIGRVFEPFFTTKGVGKGTGLGLSQVYGFARQSGGAAHISSTLGRGTEIRLYLPPLSGEATAPPPAASSSSTRSIVAGRRLLLVEDDVSVAAVALELLEGLGLEVRAVETGPQARDLLKRERFDIMLSDVVMPGGMTGIELARLCGRDHPGMSVVLTSGYAGEDVDAALADAPWPFLRKPYSGEQLAKVLGDLVGRDEDAIKPG
ncbi:MAG: PAS domain S-box protein [Brevundimonas sp.]|uniref:PAS domain S-box protein n=1 Tax=Brevundimonas sp. TaxID=1871086 RepID=UPI00273301D4|nr:PAS domain S-box protein [Brevundimonas sp.]MDP3657180.1 PAS domain S-box protein [Brevundimonas sp.]MDZ4112917.1 PAS domain S-box protein [Brevundimonas sp.]